MENDKLQEVLDKILFEIRWLEKNQTPPVNYLLVIVVSMLSSALITWLFTH